MDSAIEILKDKSCFDKGEKYWTVPDPRVKGCYLVFVKQRFKSGTYHSCLVYTSEHVHCKGEGYFELVDIDDSMQYAPDVMIEDMEKERVNVDGKGRN